MVHKLEAKSARMSGWLFRVYDHSIVSARLRVMPFAVWNLREGV
jgi:hypothetical protein